VTAWLAMEVLGGDYRFETRFYLDDKRVLYVRGGGDPFLISEELAPLATKLVAAVGKKRITGIVLDASTLRTSASRASRTPTRPTMR
jgi:serine-type D-Ala-D-Ala carboxypeptidase/endopeptidase (penicillin-binding protein 4)